MEKVIAQTSKWKVTLTQSVSEVELYDLVFSDREVMAILNAIRKPPIPGMGNFRRR